MRTPPPLRPATRGKAPLTQWRTRPQRLRQPSPHCRSAAVAARQGKHGRDLVPSGSSLLPCRHRRGACRGGHEPAPLPLYIGQRTLIDECPLYVFFTLFGCWGGGVPRGPGHNLLMQFSSHQSTGIMHWSLKTKHCVGCCQTEKFDSPGNWGEERSNGTVSELAHTQNAVLQLPFSPPCPRH